METLLLWNFKRSGVIFINKKLINELRNGVRIMSIEARYLYSANKMEDENGNVTPIESGVGYDTSRYWEDDSDKVKIPDKLYGVKIPYSLCLEKMYELDATEFKSDFYDIWYSDMVINVSFKGSAKKEKVLKSGKQPKDKIIVKQYGKGKNEFGSLKKVKRLDVELKRDALRKYMYKHGFFLNGEKYVYFMRSTSKSRGGNMLFIKQKYFYDLLMQWARLGIVFAEEETIDIAGIKSYESLVLSGICGKIQIQPEEILLINDYESVFTKKASVTKTNEKGRLEVVDEDHKYSNAIWDGQSLMDSSKYKEFVEFDDVLEAHSLCDKAFVLLRNLWFKSAAFNFDIQKYFEDNNVTLKDLKKHGWTIATDIKQIKLITTPNSLKILKIKQFIENKYEKDKNGQLRSMFEYWLNYIRNNSYFGIVKSEHGMSDHARRCNAQILMALPLSRTDIRTLLNEGEFPYMHAMRNDEDMFLMHIGSKKSSSNTMISELSAFVPEFTRTDMFTSFKNNTLNDYKNNWRKEGIKIPNSDFCVCVSNPLEMIQYACGVAPSRWKKLHADREVYCKYYDEGQELIAARNPCVSSGNIICVKNKYHELLDYMKLSDNIIVVNSIKSDIMERASGMDYDSDALWVSSNELLVDKAKYCEEHFLTPVNMISREDCNKHDVIEDLAETDSQIARGRVGDIVNVGEILLAYYWHIFFDTTPPKSKADMKNKEKALKRIYDKISMLSSASGAEIDSAKRKYKMETAMELSDLRQLGIGDNEDKFLAEYMEYGKITGARKKTITEHELEQNPDILEAFNCIQGYEEKRKTQELSEEEKEDLKNNRKTVSDFLIHKHKKDDSKAIKKLRKPLYFKFAFPNSVENSLYFENGMNCPMDNLCTIVDSKETPTKDIHEKHVNIMDLMNRYETRGNDKHREQVKKIAEEYTTFCKRRKFLFSNNSEDEDIKGLTRQECFERYVKDVKEINLTPSTIVDIFNACYGSNQAKAHNDELSKIRKNLLDLIYAAHRDKVLECFNGRVVFGQRYLRIQFLRNVNNVQK
ncbi:MAG: hypothetical protein IJN64_06290 [Lachnospiraceae bacterium]|nr:hypothetical protein [Lachnospiraceae bacterium]